MAINGAAFVRGIEGYIEAVAAAAPDLMREAIMSQMDALSTTDHVLLRTALSRMTGNALGALSVLSLMCLGDLPGSDPRHEITERHDVWRSYLLVIGEMMKAQHGGSEEAHGIHLSLLRAVDDLRNAYMELADWSRQPRLAVESSYSRLAKAYDQLELLIQRFADAINIDVSVLPKPGSLKRVSYQRSLDWLRQELLTRSHAPMTGS
jgi:hypothetical protein